MTAGVPFALLAAVQLTAVAAWLALAAGVTFPGMRRITSLPIALGALVLAIADAYTGSALGVGTSTPTAFARAGGAALLGLGLLRGAPQVRRRGGGGGTVGVGGAVGVGGGSALAVAPLATVSLPAATLSSLLLVAAAVLAVRRPAVGRWPLTAALALAGLAAGLAVHANTSTAAGVAVLVLRGLSALALIGWAGVLARDSLLAKVVGAILGTLVAASVVIVVVVGSVVTDRLGAQQATQVSDVARGGQAALESQQAQGNLFANVLAADPRQAKGVAALQDGLSKITGEVRRDGGIAVYADGTSPTVDQAPLADLPRQAIVRKILEDPATSVGSGVVVLTVDGKPPLPLLLSVAEQPTNPGEPARGVAFYGVVLDQALLAEIGGRSTSFSTSIVALDGRLAGSSNAAAGERLAQDPRVAAAAAAPPDDGSPRVQVSGGSEETIGFVSLIQSDRPVALLVVSAPAGTVVSTQRDVLQVLFIALVGTAVLVALLALLLGRQVVEPVRRLTAAAERVRRGEMSATAGVEGRDEVARLSQTFDAMTGALRQGAADLRATAVQERGVRARLETVLASITDALVVADAKGRVESVNPAAELLVGRAADTVGRRLADVVRGLPLNSDHPVEGLLERAGGGVVPVVLDRAPLADGAGTVVVLRDTSREREVERMKTEFLSNVSHELRTPLTPIRGYADILVRRGATLPPEKTAHYAGVVLESSKRLSRVVDLLVDVAALDAGRVQPQAVPVVVGAFVDTRLAEWREKIPARAGDLRRRVGGGLPRALVDEAWLAKAVDELLDNALKYSPAGTSVTLGAAHEPGSDVLRVWVRDLGEGIPADRRAALFSDFEQVDGSATRARDGLGLGLAFVRRVAEVVGVRLSVDTEVGRGSTFTLEVPVAPAGLPTPAPRRGGRGARPDPAASPRAPRRVPSRGRAR